MVSNIFRTLRSLNLDKQCDPFPILENKFEERYAQLYRRNSASTQVQSPLIDMEVKKSISKTKQGDESFKGISLVFSKTIPQPPRLSSSATTWAAEAMKMKCIFNKGIAFCSNDTIRHNLSTEVKVPDHKSPKNTLLEQVFDGTSSDQNLEQIHVVTESADTSKTKFAADIYSLVKSSSNMLILEKMKANQNMYNLHLGTIFTQANDECLADQSLVLNNIIEIPKCSIDKPETVHSKEKQDTIYDRNICKTHSKTLIDTGEEIIEMEDIKNKINATDLGPGVLTVALLDDPTNENKRVNDVSVDQVQVNEQEHGTFTDEIKVSFTLKDRTGCPTSVNSRDELYFVKSLISENCDNVGGTENLTSKTTSPSEELAKISIRQPFYSKIPKTLSVIQETGYSDVNFSDSVLQSLSNTKLDLKKSDSVKLISSDSAVYKTSCKINFEPEASTSDYKQILKSFIYSSEDDALITLEKNHVTEKDKQSICIDKLKIGEPIEQTNENNTFQCEPF